SPSGENGREGSGQPKKDREAPARSAKHRRSTQAFLLWQKLQAAARSARWIREKVHQPEDRRTVRTRWHQFRGHPSSGDTILNFPEIDMVSPELGCPRRNRLYESRRRSVLRSGHR